MIGIWKLVTQEIEIQATGQKEPVMGRSPTGYAIFTAEGRVMFVLTGEGRKPPQTVEDRADLLGCQSLQDLLEGGTGSLPVNRAKRV